MIAFRFALAATAASFLAGCHGGVETDVMERELRLQEDKIYHLLDQVDQYRMMLDACQRENQRLKAGLDGDSPPERGRGPDASDYNDLEPPEIQPGEEIDGGQQIESLELPPAEDVPSPSEQSVIPSAEQVTVQPMVIKQGSSQDASRQSITVLVQPRSAAGEVVRVPAQVSLMIMGTRANSATVRLGRWDFSSEQAQARWQDSEDRAGMEFSLPWPDRSQAARGPFQLWARLVLPEGRKLLAHTDVDASQIAREPARGIASRRAAGDGFRARDSGPRPGSWTARTDGSHPRPTRQQRAMNRDPARAADGRSQGSRSAPRWQPYR